MKRVMVIGGGPAGLTAATELLKRGNGEYEVTLLEESEKFGGISRTVRHGGNRMDLGGHRFFSKDDRGGLTGCRCREPPPSMTGFSGGKSRWRRTDPTPTGRIG